MADPTGTVLTFLLDYTKDYLQYNFDLIGGANENARLLLKEIGKLSTLVEELTKKSDDNVYLEKVADAVQDLLLQAEDTAEKFIVYSSRQQHRRGMDRFFNQFKHWGELRSIGTECQGLTVRINDLYKNQVPNATNAAALLNAAGGSTGSRKRIFHKENDKIFGLDDVATDLRKRLFGGSEELEVHTIVGMVGLGKTTAAYKIFNDDEIEHKFTFARAFVRVSSEYDKKEVFLKILARFIDVTGEIRKMSEETIVRKVKEQLEGLQYLIVLDDVWKPEAWDDLQVAFPRNKKHSRILITTRETPVAHHVNPSVAPYQMRYMTDVERKDLLRWKVFGEIGCPAKLEEQIKDHELLILHRSGGLPLAIVVIAGLLLGHKNIPDHWKKVSERVKNFDHAKEEQSTDLVRDSFNNLPYYIKPCFLYLGVFPEDFDIPVWKLLRLWIAEGFIQGEGNLEDIAERYLEELVVRNLVMVAENRKNGGIKKCRLHDFLRVFCKSEAIKKNVFQETKGISGVKTGVPLDDCTRLAINSSVIEYVRSSLSGERVRSFLSFSKEQNERLPKKYTQNIPKAFKLLRVMDVESVKFEIVPPTLYQLVLLKYVAISSDIETLPEELSHLWNLQTIIIKTSSPTLRIEADIWLMRQLRHLHFLKTSTFLPKVKKAETTPKLSKIQTISTIAPESCTSEVFERCKELKKLGIQGNLASSVHPETGPGLFDHLPILESLESLKLINVVGAPKLLGLPDDKKFPSQLSKLTLWRTKLEWKHISTLGKLEKLTVLKLKEEAFVGEFWDVKDEGFPHLTVLHIEKTNLLKWTASAPQFPQLTVLVLKECKDLIGIPDGFSDIDGFQKIDMLYGSRSAVKSANEIKKKNPGFVFTYFPPE